MKNDSRTITSNASAYPSMGLPGGYDRNHYTRPHFDIGDGEGSGEGEGAGVGSGEGEGEAFDGIDLSADDAGEKLVRVKGLKDPIKVKDLIAAHGLKGQHEAGLATMGKIAEALKAGRQGQGKGQQGKGGQGQGQGTGEGRPATKAERDILKELESQDLLDGKTMAGVLREFQTGTMNPVVQAVIQLANEVKSLKGHTGRMVQRDTDTDFQGELKGSIEFLKLPRVDGKPIEGEEILTELARDLFMSYDEADHPKLRGETFQKLMKERHDAILKYAKAYQKSELEAGRQRARNMRFTPKGASSSANGKGRKMMTNAEASAALFAGQDGANA